MKKRAFTLVEILIVVAILGIIAAIIIPQLQGYTTQAKESAARDNLRAIRNQIELYKMQHGGLTPGYVNTALTLADYVRLQLVGTTTVTGSASTATIPSGNFIYGPYLQAIPDNPFNGLSTIGLVLSAGTFASKADGTSSGWLYKRETGEFRLNWTGSDSKGISYVSY